MKPEVTSTTPVEMPIKAKHLAARFNMKATAFRRILRSMPEYADGVHTNYAWAEKDPRIPRIEAKIKSLQAEKQARQEAAKAALEARIKATEAAAKLDAAIK
jgi:hypothetical protein